MCVMPTWPAGRLDGPWRTMCAADIHALKAHLLAQHECCIRSLEGVTTSTRAFGEQGQSVCSTRHRLRAAADSPGPQLLTGLAVS